MNEQEPTNIGSSPNYINNATNQGKSPELMQNKIEFSPRFKKFQEERDRIMNQM